MKPLLPTLKENKRYLGYEIRSERPISASALLAELTGILGRFDSARAGMQMIKHDSKTGRGVLRTSVEAAPRVRAAMVLCSSINGPARIRILSSSGILNRSVERIASEV